MGYPRALHYACALASSLLLSACEDRPRTWRESEIQEIARAAAPQPYVDTSTPEEIAALNAEIEELRAYIEYQAQRGNLDEAEIDSLRARVDVLETNQF